MTTTQTPDGAAGYPAEPGYPDAASPYAASPYAASQPAAGYPADYPAQPVAAQPPQTLSILSLIAGLGSLLFGLTFVVPLAAIILGFMARSREPASRTMSTWGIVLGFVSMFGWMLVALPLVFALPFLLFGLF